MSVDGNIPKLYIIRCAKWFMLYMPIIGLFYDANGLSATEIFLVQAAYSFASALFAIPSGYFADVIGRKKTLIIGTVFAASGFLIYATIHSFWAFFIAEAIMGIGNSCISGTDSAMLYDSLQQSQNQNKYLKYEGRVTSLGCLAETTAALFGGSVAAIVSANSVFWLQACIAAMAIPAALLLVEPSRGKLLHKTFKQVFDIGFYALFKHKGLSRTTLMSSVTGIATLTMAWTIQTFFVEKDFTEIQTTIVWVLLNLTVALSSMFSDTLENKFGVKPMIVMMVLFIPFGYFAFSFSNVLLSLFFAFVFYFVRGYATPILKELIQNYCDSEIRATVLSVRDLLIRLGFSVVGPFIGYLSDSYSFSFAMISAGLLFLITSLGGYLSYLQLRKYEKQQGIDCL
ncbi:MAG: MFS transporter [Bacteroidales bacterium]|nr:MFS transporter [Bacteroidales bacterium]